MMRNSRTVLQPLVGFLSCHANDAMFSVICSRVYYARATCRYLPLPGRGPMAEMPRHFHLSMLVGLISLLVRDE